MTQIKYVFELYLCIQTIVLIRMCKWLPGSVYVYLCIFSKVISFANKPNAYFVPTVCKAGNLWSINHYKSGFQSYITICSTKQYNIAFKTIVKYVSDVGLGDMTKK